MQSIRQPTVLSGRDFAHSDQICRYDQHTKPMNIDSFLATHADALRLHASLDGNTVEKHLEQARFAENSVRYEASLQFAKRRVDSLIRSLRGE